MNSIFSSLDASLVSYFIANNIKESDFYCRECGNLMIDVNEIKDLIYHSHTKSGKPVKKPCVMFPHARTPYVESEQNRWCINGRNLSGKLFFRHLCWSCFFRKLKDTEDIARKARKSKWYAKILNGIDVVPPAWASPSPYYKLLFDITDDELNAERAKFDTASLQSFIRRKGEVEGKLAYEAYRQRQAYTCSKEYMSKTRGWSEDDWNKFNASRASTEENFLKRYGEEEGRRKWKEYCANEAYVGCALQYFIDKYGKEEGPLKYLNVNASKAVTLGNYIKKYGAIEGKKLYSKLANKAYSKISQVLFKKLDKELGDISVDSKFEEKDGEQVINLFFDDGTCKVCRPDYILHTKIIEFNGDFWHANPAFYNANDIIYTSETYTYIANDIWQRDLKRKEALEKLGYKVKVVWEKDFYEDQEKVIEDCLDFLKA